MTGQENPMFDWEQEISKRLESLNLAPSREAVIVEELAQHLEDRYKDLLDAGLTEDCAYRTVLAELGRKERCYLVSNPVTRSPLPQCLCS
jgi:hypothetical protein